MKDQAKRTKAEKFQEAAQKGGRWLCSRQNDDGSIGTPFGIGGLYKTIWALEATGNLKEASRLLRWTKENVMIQPGEFHFTHENEFDHNQSFYRNCFILIGAHRLGDFEVCSEQAIARILKHQDESGGFYANLEEKEKREEINLLFTVLGGWTSLYVGRTEEAERTGRFILDAFLKPQPEFDRRYYVNWSPRKEELITEIPDNQEMVYCINAEKPIGHFYYSGAVAGFLTELYEYTGEKDYLEGAKRSISFSYNTLPESYEWPSKCKEGWGAAILYRQTGEAKHREIAENVGEITFLKNQLPDGSFKAFLIPLWDDGRGVALSSIEITAEFTFELSEMARSLVE